MCTPISKKRADPNLFLRLLCWSSIFLLATAQTDDAISIKSTTPEAVNFLNFTTSSVQEASSFAPLSAQFPESESLNVTRSTTSVIEASTLAPLFPASKEINDNYELDENTTTKYTPFWWRYKKFQEAVLEERGLGT